VKPRKQREQERKEGGGEMNAREFLQRRVASQRLGDGARTLGAYDVADKSVCAHLNVKGGGRRNEERMLI
jgi:hypothetical protein